MFARTQIVVHQGTTRGLNATVLCSNGKIICCCCSQLQYFGKCSSLASPICPQLCPLPVCNQCRVLQGCIFCFLALLDPKWATLKADFASAEVNGIGKVGWNPPSTYCVIVVIREVCLWVNFHPCDTCWTDQVTESKTRLSFLIFFFFYNFHFHSHFLE